MPITKKEFDEIDPLKKIPVLVTAKRIIKFLYPNAPSAKDIYEGKVEVPFLENQMERPLVHFTGIRNIIWLRTTIITEINSRH